MRFSGCIGKGCCHIKFFLFHLLTSVNSCFYQSSTGGKRSQLSGAFFQQRGLPEKKTVAHLNGLKFIDGRVDQIRVNNVLKIGVGAVECGFCPGNIFQKRCFLEPVRERHPLFSLLSSFLQSRAVITSIVLKRKIYTKMRNNFPSDSYRWRGRRVTEWIKEWGF